MTTANKITIVRIAMIPAFVLMASITGKVSSGESGGMAAICRHRHFLIAAASDGLDGYVAGATTSGVTSV